MPAFYVHRIYGFIGTYGLIELSSLNHLKAQNGGLFQLLFSLNFYATTTLRHHVTIIPSANWPWLGCIAGYSGGSAVFAPFCAFWTNASFLSSSGLGNGSILWPLCCQRDGLSLFLVYRTVLFIPYTHGDTPVTLIPLYWSILLHMHNFIALLKAIEKCPKHEQKWSAEVCL